MKTLDVAGTEIVVAERRRSVQPNFLPTYSHGYVPDLNQADASTASFRDFFKALRKRKLMIFTMMTVGIVCAIVLQFTMPKVYEGVATVKIDRHMNSIDTQAGQNSGTPSDDMDQIITTEIEMAQSDPVLRPVAERYNLWDVEKQTRGMLPEEVKALMKAPVELKKLKIKRPPNSYLLKIIYRANDQQLAAAVANAVAESLAQHSNDTARESLVETSSAVAESLGKMRAKMNEADTQLAEYERELGVFDPEQRATVLSSRLKDLTTELTTAQAELASRQATLTQVKRANTLSPETALAAAQVSDFSAMPSSSALADAIGKLNEAKAHYASAAAFYGPEHPENLRAKGQVTELQRQVTGLIAAASVRAEISYDQAVTRASNVQALVATTKSELDSMEAKTANYEQLRDEALNYRKFYNDLESRATLADINKSFDNDSVKLFDQARAPQKYVFPLLYMNLPIALVLSLIMGVIAAVLMDAADSRFSGPDEVASRLQLDVLATIPESKSLANMTGRRNLLLAGQKDSSKRETRRASQYREAIRALRTSVSFSLHEGSIKTLQVTSSTSGEGKSTTCSSLAISYAQAGKKVLIIDADMRRPNIHRIFGIPSSPGLSDVLEGEAAYAEAITKTDFGLSVMPAGPATGRAADLVTLHLAPLLAKAAREYDLVLVDCPPVHGAAEALEIARMADASLLVVNAEKSGGHLVASTIAGLRRARGQVLGIVLNRVRSFGDGTYSYYSYGYDADIKSDDKAKRPGHMVAVDANTAL
jgi:polysaccharide biosynthesis transport protein